jgi:hypothetical protein
LAPIALSPLLGRRRLTVRITERRKRIEFGALHVRVGLGIFKILEQLLQILRDSLLPSV